jgi:cupin fold WbuC family metalloprotein
MRKIYSKVDPDLLLHIVSFAKNIGARQDLCPPQEFLQIASFQLMKDQTFKPHKHIKKLVAHDITQESWIIIQGSVEAILYDIDDTILERVKLRAGDLSITFRGGHNYLCLEDNTLVIEVKDGPYLGQSMDKKFI